MTHETLQERLDRWFGPAFQRGQDPRIVPTDATRAERQARTALRWYSPSWREAHGEELVGTVLDVAAVNNAPPGPDTALPLRTRLDLVRGGFTQRRRSRPSFVTRSLVQSRMTPMTPEGLAWLRDRLDQRAWLVRLLAPVMFFPAYLAVFATFLPEAFGALGTIPAFPLILGVILLILYCPLRLLVARVFHYRQRALKRAGLTDAGWPLVWNPSPPANIRASDPPYLGPPTTA